jgi:hypothetical protein
LQNNEQDQRKACGGTQPGCRRKAGQLAAFPDLKKGFGCFAGFVKKKKYKVVTIK